MCSRNGGGLPLRQECFFGTSALASQLCQRCLSRHRRATSIQSAYDVFLLKLLHCEELASPCAKNAGIIRQANVHKIAKLRAMLVAQLWRRALLLGALR